MTRINAAIRPYELCDSHLMAEHRELKRIPNAIKLGKARIEGIPEVFTLGSGHVKFFYNKLEYLRKRNLELQEELSLRGFNFTDYTEAFEDLPQHLCNDWHETRTARDILKDRLLERMLTMKSIRYYGSNHTREMMYQVMKLEDIRQRPKILVVGHSSASVSARVLANMMNSNIQIVTANEFANSRKDSAPFDNYIKEINSNNDSLMFENSSSKYHK